MRATWDERSEGHPELAVAWALHALEGEQETEFAEHLPTCAPCREIVAETEDLGALLGAAVEPADPPPALRHRLLAAAAEPTPEPTPDDSEASLLSSSGRESTSSAGGSVVPMRRRRVRRALAAVAVAAAVALVVVIGGLVAANRDLADQRDAAAAQAERGREVTAIVDAASRPGTPHAVLATADGTFVGLVVDQGAGPHLLASGLAPNDAGHTYVLWALAGGRPVGLGAFDMSGSGPVTASVPSTEAGELSGYAVSLEPGRTVPAAPTQVVASGQLAR